ncbi:MAG TPA: MFS transporter [Yaniella sp.]
MIHQLSGKPGGAKLKRRYSRPAQDKQASDAEVKRATTASAIGNATEWFDYGIYAVATSYIAHHFFEPFEYPMLLTLATFAISFIIRPLGGFVWGPLGDRIGRKGVLAATILMMSAATFLIGVLPTYATIGAWAPVLLILLRVVQGFSTGGEYSGAATFMAEYAPNKRRGFFGSFLEFGTISGYAIGSAMMLTLETILTAEQMTAWGWRLPFLLALPLGLIGFYLRNKLEDTPIFQESQEEEAAKPVAKSEKKKQSKAEKAASETPGLGELLKDYWRPILVMGGMVTALNIVNYTLLTYMPTYLEQQIGLDAQSALTVILIGELAMVALMPLAGSLSDRIGRKTCWNVSLIGIGVLAVPLFSLIGINLGWAIIGYAVLAMLFVLQLGTISATFTALFPTRARFAGFAISYNVATALFGGTAALVSDFFVEVTGSLLVPAFYMMIACVVGFIAVHFMPETAGASLEGDELPGTLGTPVVAGTPAYIALENGKQPDQRGLDDEEMLEVVEAVNGDSLSAAASSNGRVQSDRRQQSTSKR